MEDPIKKFPIEEILRDDEKLCRGLFENMLNGMAYCRMVFENDRPRDFIYLDVNAAFEALTGLKGVVGKKVSEVIPGIREADPGLLEIYGRVARTGKPEKFEAYVHALKMWFAVSVYSPKKDHFVAVFDVITDQKKAQHALRASEEFFRNTFEQAAVGMSILSPDGSWVRVNQKLCDMLGYSRDELLKLSFRDVTYPQDLPGDLERVRQMVSGERSSDSWEKRYIRKDGRVFWVRITTTLFSSQDGLTKYFITAAQDISERKYAQEEALKSHAQLSNALKIAQLGPWEYDAASDLFTFNDAFYAIFRTTADKVGGYTMSPAEYAKRFVHPEDASIVAREMRQAMETADPYFSRQLDHRIIYANGEVGYITVRYFVIKDSSGKTIRTYGVNQDITERKLAEERIKALAKFPSENPNPVLRVTREGKVIYSNRAGLDILDKWNTELEGVVPERWQRIITGAFSEPSKEEDEDVGGRIFAFIVQPVPEGGYANLYGRDITERKSTQDALKESEERFRAIFDYANDGILVADESTRKFVLANATMCRMLGYSEEELLRMGVNGLHPEQDLPAVIEQFERQRRREQVLAKDTPMKRKDGSVFYADISATPFVMNGKKCLMGIFRDITERKKAEEELMAAYEELKKTQAQLIQSNKMSALGQLASGVAHELNNPLTGVLNNVQLIKLEAASKQAFSLDDFKELLDIVENSALRCKKIAQSLLDFTHMSKGSLSLLSLNDIFTKTLGLISTEMKLRNIVFHEQLQPDLPQVSGDAQLLQQVIYGLIINAKWAIEKKSKEGGDITVKTWHEPGKKLVGMSVSDTGIGIPEENLPKIFTPYFTTKDVGEGTGLGLALFYNIIKNHNGAMAVESKPGFGATFTVTLPC